MEAEPTLIEDNVSARITCTIETSGVTTVMGRDKETKEPTLNEDNVPARINWRTLSLDDITVTPTIRQSLTNQPIASVPFRTLVTGSLTQLATCYRQWALLIALVQLSPFCFAVLGQRCQLPL
ncbi:hypothetical protein J6590_013440 [Homalodisca vitripennis]|nr:hypothetical protein J6590_013440 [Homalodisca vitripennis]